MPFYSFLTDNITVIGLIADFIGIGGAFSAAAALWQLKKTEKENERLNHVVSVVLQCKTDSRRIVPLMVVRRKHITRAELQGILGTIKLVPSKTRYTLSHLNSREFWQDIERIQTSDNDEDAKLVIPCSSEEIEQFDVPSPI